jgi:hypothetical protein
MRSMVSEEPRGAIEELGSFRAARRRRLVVAPLAGLLGPASHRAQFLVELTGRDERRAEEGPSAALGLGVLAALWKSGAGSVKHRVGGSGEDDGRWAEDLLRIG